MYWDDQETNIKVPKPPEKVHERETLSAFGCTDAPLKSSPRSTCTATSVQHIKLEEHQNKLPTLPVPPLKETAALYLRSLEGLINAEEYENSRALVENFLAPGGEGEQLQTLLLAHASKPDVGASWIEDFWDDAYLCGRDPIPINVNYFFGLCDNPDKTKMTQLGRASSLLRAAAEVHVAIRDQTLSMDTERGVPLCMSQYRRVFAASRIPGPARDRIVTYSASAPTADELRSHTSSIVEYVARHCIVLARNRMFKFDILDATDNPQPLPLSTILDRIALVYAAVTAPGAKTGAPVGVFTTMDRTSWYEAYTALQELDTDGNGNSRNLFDIQSAVIVLALDPTVVENATEAARVYLHGTGTNRWFDRHNLIVTANGCAGINFEHSVGDGATTLRVADMIYRADTQTCPAPAQVAEVLEKYRKRFETSASLKEGEDVQELTWKLDGRLDAWMKRGFDEYIRLIESNETIALHFQHFGGNYLKRSNLSPDAFVQLAFQQTYYRLFGRIDATYEAASTRTFLHGRTEVVRSASRSAADFAQSAAAPVFSRRIHSRVPSQYELLRAACDDHVGYMKLAKAGHGVDRHMLGLRLIAMINGRPLHPIFTDAAFSKSSHWNLSTSHCGSSALNLFGFGPVVADGFGLGYMIKNDDISVVVTSKYTHKLTSSSIFASMLEASLLHMKCICESQPEQRRETKPQALQFSHPTGVPDFEYDPKRGFAYRTPSRTLGFTTRQNTLDFSGSATY